MVQEHVNVDFQVIINLVLYFLQLLAGQKRNFKNEEY